jgi:ABC-2 type transport system permease protein
MSSMRIIYWRGCYAIIAKEFVRMMRIWTQTLVPPAITMSLYFLIFGKFLGQHIGVIEGVSYVQFIMPGLVMLSMISNTYMSSSTAFFLAKMQRNIEEILVSPQPMLYVLLGFSMGGLIRGLIVGLIVTIVSLFFTHLHVQHIFLVGVVAFLTCFFFSMAGILNGIFAKKFDDVWFVPTFVLTPLTYLGGVFYSASDLSGVWHKIAMVNPILYMVGSFRYAFYGAASINPIFGVSILAGFVVIIFILNWVLLEKGVGIRS